MLIAVTCPRCHTAFGITDELAAEPVSCPKCANVFQSGASVGIQAGAPRPIPSKSRGEDDTPMPPSRPHAPPRTPFPTVPLLVLVCGLLFLLLAISAGFNLWIVGHPELRIDRDQEAVRAEEARVAAVLAEQRAQLAAQNQQKAQQDEAKLKRDLDALRRELEDVRAQLDDAKRKLDKEK